VEAVPAVQSARCDAAAQRIEATDVSDGAQREHCVGIVLGARVREAE
jgi:hypothetical protein